MRITTIALFSLLLSACEQPELYDAYPEIRKSEQFIIAHFTYDINVTGEIGGTDILTATMNSGSKCKLLVDVQRYKKHSIVITPGSIFCEEERIKMPIPGGAISKAYIDTGFLRRYPFGTMRFELYNSDFVAGIEQDLK